MSQQYAELVERVFVPVDVVDDIFAEREITAALYRRFLDHAGLTGLELTGRMHRLPAVPAFRVIDSADQISYVPAAQFTDEQIAQRFGREPDSLIFTARHWVAVSDVVPPLTLAA